MYGIVRGSKIKFEILGCSMISSQCGKSEMWFFVSKIKHTILLYFTLNYKLYCSTCAEGWAGLG